MKLVHLSDLHLGYRQYHRQTTGGLNQREADVALAFKKTMDAVIDLKPDVILIGGDVFHSVRPTTPAILHAYKQFARLRELLPDTIVVMVAGNHDTPRTTETGHIIRLFSALGITVVDTAPKRLTFRDGELSILAIPSQPGKPWPAFDPDPAARYNVLLIHGAVEGVVKRFTPISEPGAGDLTVNQLSDERWDYIALGHYHVYHQVAKKAFYSGSLEYTSTNVWGEVDEEQEKRVDGRPIPGKGFIERDLATGAHEFRKVSLARRVVDLPAIQGASLSASELSDAITHAVESTKDGIENKIVRLVVRDVQRHVLRDIDHRKIREFKRSALHFLLDVRKPASVRIDMSGAPGRRASLIETVKTMLESRDMTPGIDRQSLVDLGMHYLLEADRLAPALSGDEA
ncbi:MAG: DNA repair exonuclease [Gemmatimonadaceae bacterium]